MLQIAATLPIFPVLQFHALYSQRSRAGNSELVAPPNELHQIVSIF